jgi:hypothetical protein
MSVREVQGVYDSRSSGGESMKIYSCLSKVNTVKLGITSLA